jgi:hypothetical protein
VLCAYINFTSKGLIDMKRTKFSDLRNELLAKPGIAERLAATRQETDEEIRLYTLHQEEETRTPVEMKDDLTE